MLYDFSPLKKRADEILEWLKNEFAALRTGRATPALIEKVQVNSYGAMQELKQLAGIAVEDAKTLRVTPWDKNLIKEVQNAIDKANLGVSCIPDDAGLRVKFPEMTEENRKKMVKVIYDKLESAKVSLRKEREKVWNDIQEKEKEKQITEDDKFKLKDDLQEIIDEYTDKLDELAEKKEKEILET